MSDTSVIGSAVPPIGGTAVLEGFPPRAGEPPPKPPAPAGPTGHRNRRALVIAIAAAVALVAALLAWAPWSGAGPAAPKGISTDSVEAASAVIRWMPSTDGKSVDRYLVLRDGAHVGTAAGTATSYHDAGLRPGSTYRYRVVAVSGDARSGPSAEVAVTTLTPVPVGLVADSATSSSIVIRWSQPPESPLPERYEIVRDGETIATVSGVDTTYTDRDLTVSRVYRYQVVAVWDGHRSQGSAVLEARTQALSPSGLTVGAVTATTAAFGWSPSPDPVVPDSYEILRNGTPIGKVPGSTTSYTDTGLEGDSSYEYEVRAVWSDRQSELSPALAIRTRRSDAPLQRGYSVEIKIVKMPGGGASGSVGQTWNDTWTFQPQCAGSACNVVVSADFAPPGYRSHPFDVTLARNGAEYSGTVTAHITHCETLPGTEVDVQNTVTVRITGPATNQWDSWSGTIVVSAQRVSGALYSCPAQSWTASLNAHTSASAIGTGGSVSS